MTHDWSQDRVSNLPDPEKYWKYPDFAKEGNARPEPIFEAVGYALSAWEEAEDHFAHLFSQLVGEYAFAARRAYGTIDMNTGRRNALMAAAEMFFIEVSGDPTAKEQQRALHRNKNEFATLMQHFARASNRRNDIAHGMVLTLLKNGCFLAPAWYNSKKYRASMNLSKLKVDEFERVRAEYRYTREDIIEFGHRFTKLGNAAISYCSHLRDAYPRKRPTRQ